MPYYRVREAVIFLMGPGDQATRFTHGIAHIAMLRAEEFPEECRSLFLEIKGNLGNLRVAGNEDEDRLRGISNKLLKLFLYLHERENKHSRYTTSIESATSDMDKTICKKTDKEVIQKIIEENDRVIAHAEQKLLEFEQQQEKERIAAGLGPSPKKPTAMKEEDAEEDV